jgi:ATP-dependent Lon protease
MRVSSQKNAHRPERGDRALVPIVPIRDAVHFPHLVNTLHVGRESSLRAVRRAMETGHHVLVLSQRDMSVEDPSASDLTTVGTVSEILNSTTLPDATLRLALRGLLRARVLRVVQRQGVYFGEYERIEETYTPSLKMDALIRECIELFAKVVEQGRKAPPEALQSVARIENPGLLADSVVHHLPLPPAQKQAVLEVADPATRLEAVHDLLVREARLVEFQHEIRSSVQQEVLDSQREYFLREQLKIIQAQLREGEEGSEEAREYRERIEASGMAGEALERALKEVGRLGRTPVSSPEGVVLRNYLDCLVALPWKSLSEDNLDLDAAAGVLDADHFGLVAAKERILDYLAVRKINPAMRGPVLCFVGPPGVGKTSLGRSIARALGREFVSVSVGGMRDEAELRGHRRTYVGALPGRIIQALRQCGTRNPVFMLDELDKMSFDFRGDPAGALLDVLDANQNHRFSDHFVEVPFDLSAVMFIATANVVDLIPAALRDRLEFVPFSSYTREERLAVAEGFLVPKTLREHGLTPETMTVDRNALGVVVDRYTYEAGVRNLERQIATLCRKATRRIAGGEVAGVHVDEKVIEEFLGKPPYRFGSIPERDEIGAATGLVVSGVGGDAITIEASLLEPATDHPEFLLTGNLGDVMKESAQAAVTYIRSIQRKLAPGRTFKFDVHVHVPEGAVAKEGPSAGLTIAVALASAFSGRPVRHDYAMTGEITLRGNVLPVGGVKEKVLAAHRAGIKHVVLPVDNARDLEDLPESVRSAIQFHLVSSIAEAIDAALPPAVLGVVETTQEVGAKAEREL